MPRAPHEATNVPEAGIGTVTFTPHDSILAVLNCRRGPIGGHPYPPPSVPTQVTQGEPNFIDGSGPIFSMYLEMAGEEDEKMVEGWKADADGILIFVCLYRLIWCFTPTQWS